MPTHGAHRNECGSCRRDRSLIFYFRTGTKGTLETFSQCLALLQPLVSCSVSRIFKRHFLVFFQERLPSPSPECGFGGGGGWKESGEGDTEEGGAGVIPAHLSDSHLPQRVNVPTALRLLHGRLAAHPSPSLPSSVQSCIGTLCLCLALGPHQSLQGS